MLTCVSCGSTDGVVISQLGPLVSWECSRCRTENTVHFYIDLNPNRAAEPIDLPKPGDPINPPDEGGHDDPTPL